MNRNRSTRRVTMLLFALALAFNASPATTDTLHRQMLVSIADAVDNGMAAVPEVAFEGALRRAHALTSVQVDATGDVAQIRLHFDQAPVCRAEYDAGAGVVRIDLANTVIVSSLQTSVIDGGTSVTGIDTELTAVHPYFSTHVEIAVATEMAFKLRETKNEIAISVFPGKAASVGVKHARMEAEGLVEIALRNDDITKSDRGEIEAELREAHTRVDEARLAFVEVQLAGVTPGAQTGDTGSVKADFERRQAQTAMIEADYHAMITHRAQRIEEAIRSPHAENFKADEAAYMRELRALGERLHRQSYLNGQVARQIEQLHVRGSAPVLGAARSGLDRLEFATAGLRNDKTAVTGTPEQAKEVVAVSKVDVEFGALSSDTLAVLTRDDAPPAPRTSRARRASRHHMSLDPIARPGKMAVLRSSDDAAETAKREGTIRLAQQITDVENGSPATPVQEKQPERGPRRYRVPKTTGVRPAFTLYHENMPADEDPLRQLVNIDFRDMDLTNVVSLLAQKGQINVIAGTEVDGTVTANLKNIPLGRAIEIVLRMNGLGIVEEAGVYRITSYSEAISAQRETRMIFLKNAQSDEVKATLDEILTSDADGSLVSVSSNQATNVIIVAGPLSTVEELEGVISELDVAEPVVPTLTLPIKLNYSDPADLVSVVKPMLTEAGKVTADVRSRHLIVTDIPIKVQEIQALVDTLDLPVKQVSINAMIVDAQIDDDAESGVNWVLGSTSSNQDITSSTFSTEDGVTTTKSGGDFRPKVSTVQSFLPASAGAQLFFKVLSGDIDLTAIIAAEVASNDAELLANPTIVTVENKPAIINITQEFPFQELTQTQAGGQLGTTEFKEIGTILEVTPRVTHDNHILADIDAKQSNVVDFTSSEVPIEAKRTAKTTLRLADGQTIFIGGLRSHDERLTIRKTPILGDIPILNFLFTNKRSQQNNKELMIFLTCNVLADEAPDLTPYQKDRYDTLGGTPWLVDGTRALVNSYVRPGEQRDPFYKWRRTK